MTVKFPNKKRVHEMLIDLFDHPLTTPREREALDAWYSRSSFSISEIRKIERIQKMILELPTQAAANRRFFIVW